MSILLYLQVFSTKFTESWFVVGSFCGMWKMWNLYFVLIIQYLSFCIEVMCMGEYLCNNKSKYAFFSYFLYLVFYLCVWLFGGVFEFVLCLHLKKLHLSWNFFAFEELYYYTYWKNFKNIKLEPVLWKTPKMSSVAQVLKSSSHLLHTRLQCTWEIGFQWI